MKTIDFDFTLPEELIAQTPLTKRSSSRLMVINKEKRSIEHKHFFDIIDFLEEGDVLVLNDTKVIPARLHGIKEDTTAAIELLLLKETDGIYEALVKPARRVKVGTIISFKEGMLKAVCQEIGADGIRYFKMIHDGIFLEILDKLGEMPLPPYIHEKLNEKNRYQTVYAKEAGSAAAPTAGLHFTSELMDEIIKKGVQICYITLHVGLGTFRPVSVTDIKNHQMHKEYYEISKTTSDLLNKACLNKKRIISVGTTTTRALESAYDNGFKPVRASTDIFIYPGYKFKVTNALITNFHLPKSTLIMLVSAFADRDLIIESYKQAIEEKYRFYSFGDSMLIF